MDDFESDIQKYIDKTQKMARTVTRKISLDLLKRVMMRSPVRTGRFRGNWQLTIGAPAPHEIERLSKVDFDEVSVGEMTTKDWKPADGSIFVTNNLPYAERLEYGWSKQAPNGMVRISLAEVKAEFARLVEVITNERDI